MDDATGLAVNHKYSKHGKLHIYCTSSTSVIKLQLRSRLSSEYSLEKPCRDSILFWERSIFTMLPILACQLWHVEKRFIDKLSTCKSWRHDISQSSDSLLEDRFRCCNFGTNLIAQSTLFMLLLAKFMTVSFFQIWKKQIILK